MVYKIIKTDNYLLVVDDKDKDFYAYNYGLYKNYKLGLVTGCNDDILEFEGECIDESNLSKVIAHLPLNGSPILEGVPLLPPYSRHQEDDTKKATEKFRMSYSKDDLSPFEVSAFAVGYSQAREKYKYTEENVRYIIMHSFLLGVDRGTYSKEVEDRILQSLYQYSTEFECKTEPYTVGEMSRMPLGTVNQKPKTITTTQGIQWVGKYL